MILATDIRHAEPTALSLFLCGDVMTGRGVDQILRHPGSPRLYEPCVDSALEYVGLAEATSGAVPRAVADHYVWGDALAELERRRPQLRIVNLETAVTARGSPAPKGINYRMHPDNVGLLRAANIDCCALANNHVLDWGEEGLADTLAALARVSIAAAGAGANADGAWAPAVLAPARGGRVLVFACGTGDSGIAPQWAARANRAGVARLGDLAPAQTNALSARILAQRREGDRVVVSIHWGDNWGFDVTDEQRRFAHALIDAGAADVVHGHSSHHVKGIEVHRGRLILYGCGDFLNDYEGIAGHEEQRGDLGLMYFPTLGGDGRLLALELVPTRIRRFRIERAQNTDHDWLRATLRRECSRFGTDVSDTRDGAFALGF